MQPGPLRKNYGGSPSAVQENMYRRGGAQMRDDASADFGARSPPAQAPPSSKAHGLVGEIVALETQCGWLEDRNSWLTSKLLQDRRKFIDRALMSNKKVVMSEVFKSWLDCMGELRMEHQLNEQTRALEQCQQVTNELGEALAQEQELRKEAEAEGRALREENKSLLAENQSMRQQVEERVARVQLLERQVQEAESCLGSSRSEAQSALDRMEAYESGRKGRGREAAQSFKQADQQAQAEEPIERSQRMRGEAQGTMQKVQQLLPSGSQSRVRQQSPERTMERAPTPGPVAGGANYGTGVADSRARTPQRASRPQQPPELDYATGPVAEVRSRLQNWQQQTVASEATASPPSGMRVPSPEPERNPQPLRVPSKENVYGLSSSGGIPEGLHRVERLAPGSPSVPFRSAPQSFQAVVPGSPSVQFRSAPQGLQPSPQYPGSVQVVPGSPSVQFRSAPQGFQPVVMQPPSQYPGSAPAAAQPVIGVQGVPPGGSLEPWWAARRAASPMRVAAPTL